MHQQQLNFSESGRVWGWFLLHSCFGVLTKVFEALSAAPGKPRALRAVPPTAVLQLSAFSPALLPLFAPQSHSAEDSWLTDSALPWPDQKET